MDERRWKNVYYYGMESRFNVSDYIDEIELSGLRGRMIDVPAQKKAAKTLNILLFHGHHSSLERLSGIAEMLSEYGNFTLPDMPGFGGMDPLQKVGLEPTIDNLADYMAAFIKMKYGKKKKFVAVGYSFGFLVLVRMLQKYPDIQAQVQDIVGVASFVRHDAFRIEKRHRRLYMFLTEIAKNRLVAFVIREVFLRRWFIGTIQARSRNARVKYQGLSRQEYRDVIRFETKLWRVNDIYTRCVTAQEMLTIDLLKANIHIPSRLISVIVDDDHYFDNSIVEQQLKIMFDKVKVYRSEAPQHSMSVLASAKDAEPFFPAPLREYLRSLQ